MIKLEDVTLCIADTKNPDKALKVLMHCQKELLFGDVKFFTNRLPANTEYNNDYKMRKIKIIPVESMDWQGYSNFILYKLHSYLSTDFVLICQTDGFVLNPDLWQQEFLNYDYIGAKWRKEHLQGCSWIHESVKREGNLNTVGNGGFSLRSRKLLQLTAQCPYKCEGPEDAHICNNYYKYFTEHGIKYAPEHVADVFSKEQNESLSYNKVFGFHGNPHLYEMFIV